MIKGGERGAAVDICHQGAFGSRNACLLRVQDAPIYTWPASVPAPLPARICCRCPDRWQQKGLDPKYYHTEPDGSNWVYSFASQSLLNAAHQPAFQPAPWDLDPNLVCDGLIRARPVLTSPPRVLWSARKPLLRAREPDSLPGSSPAHELVTIAMGTLASRL